MVKFLKYITFLAVLFVTNSMLQASDWDLDEDARASPASSEEYSVENLVEENYRFQSDLNEYFSQSYSIEFLADLCSTAVDYFQEAMEQYAKGTKEYVAAKNFHNSYVKQMFDYYNHMIDMHDNEERTLSKRDVINIKNFLETYGEKSDIQHFFQHYDPAGFAAEQQQWAEEEQNLDGFSDSE